ncbi:hypothetical protein AB1N83_012103 [Pleurotus pulmonarius]
MLNDVLQELSESHPVSHIPVTPRPPPALLTSQGLDISPRARTHALRTPDMSDATVKYPGPPVPWSLNEPDELESDELANVEEHGCNVPFALSAGTSAGEGRRGQVGGTRMSEIERGLARRSMLDPRARPSVYGATVQTVYQIYHICIGARAAVTFQPPSNPHHKATHR